MDFPTSLGLFLALLSVGLTLGFVVWQPKHPIIRTVIGLFAALSMLGALIVLFVFAPIRWQSPIMFRSPIKNPHSPDVSARTGDQWKLPTKEQLDELSRQFRDAGVVAGKDIALYYGDTADKALTVLIGQAFSNADAFPTIDAEEITFGISILAGDDMKPAADILSKFCEDQLGTKARVRHIQTSVRGYLMISIGRPAPR
jgi:hypothetical protein